MISSETPAPLSTITQTTIASETPEKTQVPVAEATPLIAPEGLQIHFGSWSPDSQWFAYWLAEDQESPASLFFANAISGETCQAENVQAPSLGSDLLLWREDGRVAVLPGGFLEGALQGIPCGAFAPVEDETLPDPFTRTSISPDGRYQAEETIGQQEEAGFHTEIQITDLTTDQSIYSMRYLISRQFVFGGPKWLNNDIYLIGMVLEQDFYGFRYYSVVKDQVSQLLPDLLKREGEPLASLFTSTDAATESFHILIFSDSLPLLYHSELDQIEELPYPVIWDFADASGGLDYFSPDGKWLLFSEVAGGHYWLRPVDPPGGSSNQLDYYGVVGGLSPDGQKLVFLHGKSLAITSFPSGKLIGQWQVSYDLQNIWWSPDSKRLIALGHQAASNQTALFVIEP